MVKEVTHSLLNLKNVNSLNGQVAFYFLNSNFTNTVIMV